MLGSNIQSVARSASKRASYWNRDARVLSSLRIGQRSATSCPSPLTPPPPSQREPHVS